MNKLLDLIKKRDGYSLVEILAALIIVSSVMIVSTSSIYSSARISINNEIADRANTMSIRVLELTKKPDKKLPECDTGENIEIGNNVNLTVGNIDLTNANQAENVCFRDVSNINLIETCENNSEYKTEIVFEFGRDESRNETYCIQVFIEDLPESDFSKVTVRTVFNDLSDQVQIRTLYGLL